MSDSRALSAYIALFRDRLVRRQWSIGLAAAAAAGGVTLLVAAWLAVRHGFPDAYIAAGRATVIAAVVAALFALGWWPARRLRRAPIATIEARTPPLNGRIDTWQEMHDDEPLRELLAMETLELAQRFTPERQIPEREIWGPRALALAAIALVGALAWLGPQNYGFALRDLVAGWAVDGLTPPQQLAVEPGDEIVRRGASLRVVATPEGFSPDKAMLVTSIAGGEWREVPMRQRNGQFERSLFSVREPVSYYIRAGAVRSETFSVDVVDLPDIDSLRLTYHYPDWTGREPEVVEPGGDVRAVIGTRVDIDIIADGPIPNAVLIATDVAEPMPMAADPARATLAVERDSEYHIAARVGDELVRLTDDYFVTVEEDAPPEILFARPGRDWRASNIEEVTTSLSVADDYRLESVALNYSVNGGEWQRIDFPADGNGATIDHVFRLEEMAGDGALLSPGDLLSYYAEATDRDTSSRTDIYFIEVQPFDRRYSQSQQSGGGGGQNLIGDEISARQREIIVSTWNLIREQTRRADGDSFIDDNAKLLAELQETLRAQATSLAERTRARELAGDEDIARFIAHLEDAATAMEPAALRLADIEFQAALGPEQQALQHLLRAESVFRDISVSMSQNRGEPGGQAGRDLSEMFELEMDLEKNQYETGSQASTESESTELDDIAEKLAELARRQEQLAERLARRGAASPSERWRQEQLRREAEELARELAQLSRGSSTSEPQSGASGSATESSASADASASESGEPFEANEANPTDNPQQSRSERRREELARRLDSALREMRSSDDAMADEAGAEEAAERSAAASRALAGASEAARDAAAEAGRDELNDFERRARDLVAEQRDAERALTEALSRADGFDDGIDPLQRIELTEQKRAMQAELARLEQDIKAAARDLAGDDPATARELEAGLERLADDSIKEQLAVAASYIEMREAQYIASRENAVTSTLEDFADRMARAASGAGERAGERSNPAADALQGARQLRAALAGLEPTPGVDPSSAFDPIEREGSLTGSGRALRGEVPDDAIAVPVDLNLTDELTATAADVRRAVSEIANVMQLSADEAAQLRQLARDLAAAAAVGRNEAIVDAEYRNVIELLDQVELALAPAVDGEPDDVRVGIREEVPLRHRDAVAEYYRQLAERDADR